MKQGDVQTILVVDDAPENIDVLVGILGHQYRVTIALTGEKALQIANSDNPPDLILLDVMMPQMDGLEVCRRLKASDRTRAIPVIFVTARGEMDAESKGFEAGAVDYIAKPVNPLLVSARVKTHLALYDQNRTLEKMVAMRTAELEQAFSSLKGASIDTILRLSRAADFKDDETGVHVIRMSNYAASVARHMTMEPAFIDRLLWAAPMHDIGKIGIPDRILLKPGKLDPTEWSFMKRHCEIGSAILSGSSSDIIQLAEIVALSHHEKWDGTGYPKGLTGAQIPIAGRISAIADVFDALTSKRPYKVPFEVSEAFDIIRNGREQHFDPEVVDAFFDIEDEILKTKSHYQDGSLVPFAVTANAAAQ